MWTFGTLICNRIAPSGAYLIMLDCITSILLGWLIFGACRTKKHYSANSVTYDVLRFQRLENFTADINKLSNLLNDGCIYIILSCRVLIPCRLRPYQQAECLRQSTPNRETLASTIKPLQRLPSQKIQVKLVESVEEKPR